MKNSEIIAIKWMKNYGVDGAIALCDKIYKEAGLEKYSAGAMARHNREIKNYLLEVKEEFSAEMSFLARG